MTNITENKKLKNNRWGGLPEDKIIDKTASSLKEKGIDVFIANSKNEARKIILDLIPKNSEIFTMTSVTLDSIGVSDDINNSGNYDSVRNKLSGINRLRQKREMKKMTGSPEFAVGSIHALTEDGRFLVASATGSQLPAYSYGAEKVIFVVGAQKIVKNIDDGLKRIYEHSLPLESERARKAYGVKESSVGKILIINEEIEKGRISIVIVKEVLGF